MSDAVVKHEAVFSGAVDIAETDEAYVFTLDTPGLTKNELKVRVAQGKLQMSGERKKHTETGDAKLVRVERSYGKFCRTFTLPEDANEKDVRASCDHGVLTVVVGKKQADDMEDGDNVLILSSEEEGDGSLNPEFEQVPISVFPTPALGKLVVINSDMPLIDAVETLSKYNILAAPLRDVNQPDDASWVDKYLGIFDMVKATLVMLEVLEPEGRDPSDLLEEARSSAKLRAMKAGDIADRCDPFVPVEFDRGTLLDPMLLCGVRNIRRVPIVKSPAGDLVNIITQSALIQTLSENLDRFKVVADKKLSQVALGAPSRVWKVSTADTLETAFKLIRDKDISAVPVVDEHTGEIKGNVSARDVRLILPSNKIYKLLRLPLRNYLDVVTQKDNSAVTCSADSTLGEVVRSMVTSRIHRIYVVDKQNRPMRVVSMTNVIRKFVKEPAGYFGHYFG